MKILLALLLAVSLTARPLHGQSYGTLYQSTQAGIVIDSFPVVVLDRMTPAIPYNAPIIYEQWWQEVMACSGLHVSRTRRNSVRFVSLTADVFVFKDEPDHQYYGWTDVFRNIIYLAILRTSTSATVKHEMLHWLSFQLGKPMGHNKYYQMCHIPISG